mmetsp:Transcript_67350/g.179803  ORF Transcript_67350/g.179803 Transcript_67350/m.179803 type:complete len:203 (-) Transcript_67350:898-1506(-)
MLPLWGSPCTCPCTSVSSANTSAMSSPQSLGSRCAAARAAASSTRMRPSSKVIVSTLLLLRSGTTCGTHTSLRCASSWAVRLALPASRVRSSSIASVASKSSTTHLRSNPAGLIWELIMRNTEKSDARSRRRFGYSILTAAARPSCSVARCTWAREAAAMGFSSTLLKSSLPGLPNSSTSTGSMEEKGRCGAWSVSTARVRV